MKFVKMHGAGNDYVYIDCFRQTVEDPESLAGQLSQSEIQDMIASGAISAGMRGAWVQRSADALFDPWGIEPTVTVKSLGELADSIGM